MSLLTQFLGGASGATAYKPTPTLLPFITSSTWIAPKAGVVITRQMGGGGSGAVVASSGTATGGGSAAWGEKRWVVTAGQVFVITVGAGGAARSSTGPGFDGGATTITSNGITVTTPGGKGGIYNTAAVALTSPSGDAPINVDFGAAGVKAGNTAAVSGAYTGGAGVNLYAQPGSPTSSGDATASSSSTGGGSTTNRSDNTTTSSTSSAGAGFLGPSVGSTAGPGLFKTDASSQAADVMPTQGPWCILPTGAGNETYADITGGGGAHGSNGGAFSGGGAVRTAIGAGSGGYGAGGGASPSFSGKGGQGYVVIEFIPAE